MKIIRMRTENRETPMGIDVPSPVFSWNVLTDTKNWRQKSYRITVVRDGVHAWDSGKVLSDQMVQIPYQGERLRSDTRYEWRVEVEGSDGFSETSEASWFETGLLADSDWKGIYIGETEDFCYHLYRKAFGLGKKVVRARLFVSGLGHHVCWINGQPVSDRVLEPGWADYRTTNFYSVYDVTGLLQKGENAIGVKLGDGMYNVPGGRYVYYARSYGKIKLNVQLNYTCEDGSTGCLYTDKTWKMAPSPIKFCCIYGGEDYDGRLERKGFSRGDYREDASWIPVADVEPPAGKRRASMMAPMRVMQRYRPYSVRKNGKGAWLYDFGTNFSGWARIQIRKNQAAPGTKIVMTPGELLDNEFVPVQNNRPYAWTYFLNDEDVQEFAPDFTYTGFRYLQVEGAVPDTAATSADMPAIEKIMGEFIYPDVEQTGEFHCSNSLFNDIHKIVCQAILSNMKSYLTDCPHREKLPWLEQTHLIAPGVMYNYDVQCLYEKAEQDMADSQRDTGLVPDICPEYVVFGYHEGFVDSPEWGSACVLNPWYMYQMYGNTKTAEKYYDVMKRYVDYLTSRTHHHVLHHGLGDWLDIGPNRPHSQNTPVPVVATCIYYYDLCVMERTAKALGKDSDAREFARLKEEVFREYNLQFYDDQTGRYATGSQAAQAMSLVVGLVPEKERQRVIEQLRRDIVNRGYAITAGDVGHPFLITAAIQNGLSDLINEMTNQTDTPGYGYQVVNGATTLTEEWDGPEPGNPHGSQNHFMLGGIEEWFYAGLGGIRMIHGKRPFGEVDIEPYFPEDMGYCHVRVFHPYGKLFVNWKREETQIVLEVKVPANLTAHIRTGENEVQTVDSGTWEFRIPVPEQEV